MMNDKKKCTQHVLERRRFWVACYASATQATQNRRSQALHVVCNFDNAKR